MSENSLPLVRLKTTEFGGDSCPAYQRGRPGSKVPGHEDVLIGAFHDGVVRRFTRGEAPEQLAEQLAWKERFGPIERDWLCAAVERFPDPILDGFRLTGRAQIRYHEGTRRELYGWGLWAYTEDHSVVRAYLPRYRAGGAPYTRTRLLATAYLAACGRPGDKPGKWYEEPHRPCRVLREPERVEVIEYYADTGESTTVYAAAADQAKREYRAEAAPLAAVLLSDERRPGNDCGRCALIGECPVVPKLPDLLGIGRRGRRTTFSATNGRYVNSCPRRDDLFRRNLPGIAPDAPELVGRIVDAFLDAAHRSHRPCREQDIPVGRDAWLRKGSDLAAEAADRATAMLRQHLPRCPWHAGPEVGDARTGRLVTVYDSVADVVVFAQVDLLYIENSAWVWHELKTRRKIWRCDPLQSRDRLQYAVALLAARGGIDGREVARVEIEQLAENDRETDFLDPTDTETYARAAEIVAEAVREWHTNPSTEPRPGPDCGYCQYRAVCPDAAKAVEPTE